MQIDCNLSSAKRNVDLVANIVTATETCYVVTFLAEYNPTLVTDVTSNIIKISTIVSNYFLYFVRALILY